MVIKNPAKFSLACAAQVIEKFHLAEKSLSPSQPDYQADRKFLVVVKKDKCLGSQKETRLTSTTDRV